MFIPNGRNLGERHRELNVRVNEAVNRSMDHNVIYSEETYDDIDKLFQIDLASRYKNLDYILDILKSGDNLFITRALKCEWIYEDPHANIINPTYLHNNLFPYMSQRMKVKMLTTISMHVRNEDRVICFHSYCMNAKLNKMALKFLIYTPEVFKLDFIANDDNFDGPFDDGKNLKQFVDNSLTLATAYVEIHWEKYRSDIVHKLRFLYSEFEEDYLNMLEKYVRIEVNSPNTVQRLGIRMSKDILKRHKKRVWNYPILYINKLNKSMLAKYLTIEDIKNLAKLLLPGTSTCFWSMDFYRSYEFILNVIPFHERFTYLKNTFCSAYDEKPFEMDIMFYNLKYYEMFTFEERESWALQHIELEDELFGSGKDYVWYKFVAFDKALEAIKQYVFITPDSDKRAQIVNVLVDSACTQENLTKLFNYYYERHVNEDDEHKINFVDMIIAKHDIFTFTEDCWTPFHKLLCSLEIYESHNTRKLKNYLIISMIYHILNYKEFPKQLHNVTEQIHALFDYSDIILTLSETRRSAVVKFWLEFHESNLKMLLEKPLDDKVQDDIQEHVIHVWHIIRSFHRDSNECPESVLSYMKLNMNVYKNHLAFKDKFEVMTEDDFMRLLKKDATLVVDGISKIMCNSYRWSFRLTRLFRKLKVYFSNDVSKKYLEYFLDSLEWLKEYPRQYRNIKMAIVGIFHLGSEEVKISLLKKYAPENDTIDHEKIDKHLFQIQKAICYLSYQSRPPVQMSAILKYITTDYVRFCLPMFNYYVMKLPKVHVVAFIDKIIDAPISIQKHGLRMAYECFHSQDLVKIIQKHWNTTNDISLKMLLYKKLHRKVLNECGNSQRILYDVLKTYTLGLDHQDHESIYDIFLSDDMPEEFKGDYIQTAWQVVNRYSNQNSNLTRKLMIIRRMKDNIHLLVPKFLRENIIDEHVRTVLLENTLITPYSSQELEDVMKAKWELTATYIITGNYETERQTENKKLVKDILLKCLQMWNHVYKGVNTYRHFCREFLNTLHDESCVTCSHYVNNISIYECIHEVLQASLPKDELYLSIWKLEVSIVSREVILEHYHAHNKCMQFKYPCTVDIADAFAKNVGELVEDLVESNEFYYSFYMEMANVLINVCKTMDRDMNTHFRIITSGYLTRFKMIETHVLAVLLMPQDPPRYWERRHENVLNMITQYDNDEIRTRVMYKFAKGSKIRHIL